MLEKLFNIFKWKKKETKPTESLEYLCKLDFGINKDGTIDIVCHWPQFTEKTTSTIMNIAYFYALAIHAINNGLLEKEILDTLQKNAKFDEYDTLFVHNVLYKLYELEKKQKYQSGDISKQPFIYPLDVFKNLG